VTFDSVCLFVRGAGPLGAAATATSIVGVAVCIVDQRWRPLCSVVGLGGTDLHRGGQEGVACGVGSEFHPGTSIFGSRCGS
jgi:hypothetical protein